MSLENCFSVAESLRSQFERLYQFNTCLLKIEIFFKIVILIVTKNQILKYVLLYRIGDLDFHVEKSMNSY